MSFHSSPPLLSLHPSLSVCLFLPAFWTYYVAACGLALRIVVENHRVTVTFGGVRCEPGGGFCCCVPKSVPPIRKRQKGERKKEITLETLYPRLDTRGLVIILVNHLTFTPALLQPFFFAPASSQDSTSLSSNCLKEQGLDITFLVRPMLHHFQK